MSPADTHNVRAGNYEKRLVMSCEVVLLYDNIYHLSTLHNKLNKGWKKMNRSYKSILDTYHIHTSCNFNLNLKFRFLCWRHIVVAWLKHHSLPTKEWKQIFQLVSADSKSMTKFNKLLISIFKEKKLLILKHASMFSFKSETQ